MSEPCKSEKRTNRLLRSKAEQSNAVASQQLTFLTPFFRWPLATRAVCLRFDHIQFVLLFFTASNAVILLCLMVRKLGML